ncbi:ACP S-malonyltransferase [Streptomyces sp. NPDC101455]|uniref:ACP S-malonyltransferase n=1 Tax=Streptomyces sp. NPDC101455 TaxID=3366142 RepID=UPI0037F219D8
MTTAFLYPGQGSQRPGMLHALPASPAITRTLDEAAGVLSRIGATGLDSLNTSVALHATTNTQLALVIAGVAAARALTQDHGLHPDFVAGHSVGAFAAAVTAGVLTFDEALEVVHLRGELMQRVCAGGEWGMGAVLGLSVREVRTLVQQVSTKDDCLWIANINAPDQIVLSGAVVALRLAESAAPGLGARRWQRLDVAVASHCPLQEPVAARLAGYLADVPRRRQQVPYLTNVRGRRIREDTEAVLDDLARSVARTVRWYDAMRVIGELGATHAVQMPPGRILARLLPDAAPATRPIAVDESGLGRVMQAWGR